MRRGSRGRGFFGGAYGGDGRPLVPHQHQTEHNIPRLLQPLQSRTPTLMAGHLQGLKDIDMELELLKRKREIIEQQQILSDSFREINEYKPMFSQGRQSRYDDFARLYDNPRESNYNGGRGEGGRSEGGRSEGGRGRGHSGRGEGGRGEVGRGDCVRKRPHIPVWENEAPISRYSSSSRSDDRPFSRHSPGPSHSRPSLKRTLEPSYSAPRHRRPTPPAREKRDFHPSKVSKFSASPPTKLASYPPAERKRPVKSAPGRAAAREDEWLLRADRPPSRLVQGRLELALGAVVKDMKAAHPQHAALFQQSTALRALKQAVRDRVRAAMTGRTVTNPADILTAYYQMFPKGQDDEVLAQGLMAMANKDFIFFESDSPEEYFKKNMSNLMILKMEEMTNVLNDHYGADALATCAPYARRPDSQPKRRVRTRRPKATGTDKPNQPEDSKKKEAESVENKQAEEMTEPNDQDQTEDEAKIKTSEDQPENEEKTNEADNGEPNRNESAEKQPKVELVKPTPIVVPKKFINNETYTALDKIMTYKMLHLLKRFAPDFLKYMNVDSRYCELKTTIENETAKKLAVKEDEARAIEKEPERKPLYYTRILAKPSLPKRKTMTGFFNHFKPKFVKKHRTIHNLLFVAFTEEEPYKKMLAADGTILGRFTLDIKTSVRSDKTDTKEKESSAEDAKTSKAGNLNDSTEIIGSDLDEQIADLLSSIRNTDNYVEDAVMAEPTNNEVEKDEAAEMDEIVDCDAEPNADEENDDVVEIKDVLKIDHDEVEINDAQKVDAEDKEQNDVETKDAERNIDDTDVGDIVEDKDIAQNDAISPNGTNTPNETEDTLPDLKTELKDVKMTPKRASTRLAGPVGIKTRRMSKLTE